jgi:hypothetical protein
VKAARRNGEPPDPALQKVFSALFSVLPSAQPGEQAEFCPQEVQLRDTRFTGPSFVDSTLDSLQHP